MSEKSLCPPTHFAIHRKISKLVAYISETFDLNDIEFDKVFKMAHSITFVKFELVAPNLHNPP